MEKQTVQAGVAHGHVEVVNGELVVIPAPVVITADALSGKGDGLDDYHCNP